MAQVTSTGVVGRTLDEYIGLLGGVFQQALGDDLSLDPETPQGQLIGLLAFEFAKVDEALVAQGNALSLATATGQQLDDIGSLFNLERFDTTRSTVTATLTGAASTIVPAGSRAATTEGVVFETTAPVEIGSGGSVDTIMRAVEYGPQAIDAGTLQAVIDPIAGWDAVVNNAAGTVGRARETDAAYRLRYRLVLGRSGRASLEAIRHAVGGVAGVDALVVLENNTNAAVSARGLNIPAHSVWVITRGGTEADVRAAATAELAAGIDMSYTSAVPIPIAVTIATTAIAGFPADGSELIGQAIVDYVSGLEIGTGISTLDLYRPAFTVPGHSITAVSVARTVGPDGVETDELAYTEYLSLDAANITVTVT